jgi:hypothetical protein
MKCAIATDEGNTPPDPELKEVGRENSLSENILPESPDVDDTLPLTRT